MYRSVAPTTALCVPLASPIQTAKDLAGKTIAVLGLHDVTEIGTWSWLERNGVNRDMVKYAEIPLPQVPGALDRAAVDAGILAEPYLSRGVDAKTVRVIGHIFDAIAPQFFISDWFTSKTYSQQNTAVVKRFVDVVYQTARWANTHRDDSAAILAQVTKIPLATIQGMTRVTYGTSLDPTLIDPVFAALYTYQLIDKKLTAPT
jgi:NitT/TauT family transport system substrate-binding protein